MFEKWFSGLGLDVSDHHLRIAQVGFFGGVKRMKEVVLPEGLVVDEQILKPQELHDTIARTLNEEGLVSGSYRATVLIPESRVFSHSMLLDAKIKTEELRITARSLAQKEMPIPLSQSEVCFSDGGREGGQRRMSVYAAQKEIFESLRQACTLDRLRLLAMETNTKAVFRLLTRLDADAVRSGKPVVIVDVGHSWTTIAIYSTSGASLFSRIIPHSKQMVAYKGKGFLPVSVVDRIFEVLLESMVFSAENREEVGLVVFVGVESQDAYLRKQMQGLVEVPCWVIGEKASALGVSKEQAHTFGAAIGAAIRSAHPRKFAYQHNFLS